MHKLFSIILLGLTILSFQALAGKNNVSNSGAYSSRGGQELVLSATQGLISLSGGNTTLNINAMYGYFFVPNVEGALEVQFLNTSGGGTLMKLFFDGIYNFQTDYNNSFFVFGGFGINSYSGKSNSSSTSGIKFGGGKRIAMWGPVSLMPILWMQKDGSADMVTNIMPLNFSVLF